MRLFLFTLLTAALLLALAPARAAEPGSRDDPVVTRSYLETLYSWQQTHLQDGQSLSLDLGVMLVLRSGQAAVVGSGAEGLVDLTAGKELKDGERIPANHLILSPASDKRGIKALSPVVLLTRGLNR